MLTKNHERETRETERACRPGNVIVSGKAEGQTEQEINVARKVGET
jgi:hypothetical protein